VSRILLSLSLIGTLLIGQTFCCCTAKAAALVETLSSETTLTCCCCSEESGCPEQDHRGDCPCKHKRQLADVGATITIDSAAKLQHDWIMSSAILPESTVDFVPLMDRREIQRRVSWTMPRADRVALSQMLLC
jgi:hypothetical protein